MEIQFVDRILTCSDCHGEFVFTAGEQLFFHDKQFKNDPKRCKPCKSRRSGLSAAANGSGVAAAGLSRTETRTECSECGVQTTVPFKPTQGRPVLCRQCFQIKNKAAAAVLPAAVPAAVPSASMPSAPLAAGTRVDTATVLTLASAENGEALSPDAAVLAAASMASASAHSSVASKAELALIAGLEAAPSSAVQDGRIPTELLAAGLESSAGERIPAMVAVESADA